MQSVHITTAFMSSAIYSRLERTPAAIFIQQHRHHSHGRTCTQRHSIHWDDIERLSLSLALFVCPIQTHGTLFQFNWVLFCYFVLFRLLFSAFHFNFCLIIILWVRAPAMYIQHTQILHEYTANINGECCVQQIVFYAIHDYSCWLGFCALIYYCSKFPFVRSVFCHLSSTAKLSRQSSIDWREFSMSDEGADCFKNLMQT